jgi:hypothetical protein
LLSAVRCLLFAVCCLLSAVCFHRIEQTRDVTVQVCCYTVVTLLLECGYTVVTPLLHCRSCMVRTPSKSASSRIAASTAPSCPPARR